MTSGLLLEQELERRILKDDKGTSYLAIKAAQDLLAKSMILRN
jgi:3-oxoacyl-[acyl-carrier-protein] synthase III